jgi:hypothetical protein
MAQWQIVDAQGISQPELFDDGDTAKPGEEGFSQAGVKAKCTALGAGFTFNYVGTPNWVPPQPQEEASE